MPPMGLFNYRRWFRFTGMLLLAVGIALCSACTGFISSAGLSSAASLVSSASTSEFLSSPFRSSSRPPAVEQEQEVEEEVKIYTASYLSAGGADAHSFQVGISDIAQRRGISDWESSPGVRSGVRRGLAEADAVDSPMTTYLQSWSGGRAEIVPVSVQAGAPAASSR
jgi:hypothetical protein